MKENTTVRDHEHKKIAYSKMDVIKLDTKCLYAGKLERIKKWSEKPHRHPFCEIMFVFSGNGKAIINGKSYHIKKGDIITFRQDNNFITHRVIRIDDEKIITKGDSNTSEDKPINKNDVLGKIEIIIPDVKVWKAVFKDSDNDSWYTF